MHNTPNHVYRTHKDADKVIQMFNRKPPEQVKNKIREGLVKEQEKFRTIEQMRSQKQQRRRGRAH